MFQRSRSVTVAATLALALMSTGLIAVLFATPAQAHSSTVTVLDGSVLVRHADGQFAPITDGDVVGRGDTVRTGLGSHGVLTFFDGTTVELEPETQITIDDLQAAASGDKVVAISQAIGRTWHVVTHLVSSRSKYEIKTGAATAEVRGTAFEVAVNADGTMTTTTTDGDVATSAQGTGVHVLAGQFTTVVPGSRPQAVQPTPEAGATVRIILDLTHNAIVTDANGRAVGVQNGVPVRYIPGSKVEVVDGKLVITIPNAQLGVLTTFVRPDAAPFGGSTPANVTIQTQVTVKGIGLVANSLTSRPVEDGTAKGAIVVTDSGLLLVPNDDARNAPAPHIGTPPAAPTGILPLVSPPGAAPLVTAVPAASGPATVPGPLVVDAPVAVDVTTAAFVPYQTSATTPSATSVETAPVNAGVTAITTPVEPVFKTVTTLAGGAPAATSAPATTPAPIVTIPDKTITLPVTVFATATPAPQPPLVTNPPPAIAVPIVATPTAAPLPAVGGFVPPMGSLVPNLPSAATATPATPTSVPTTAPIVPTVAPVTVPPVVSVPPVVVPSVVPTALPVVNTPAPTVVVPTSAPTVVVPTSAPTVQPPAPTVAPTPAPTVAPTPAPTTRVCLPLLGCL
jgi:hypothetical protein